MLERLPTSNIFGVISDLWKKAGIPKGQLISEWNLVVFKSSKKRTSFWQISALASKMGQIKKITSHYQAN
jgi:hypothetical protein